MQSHARDCSNRYMVSKAPGRRHVHNGICIMDGEYMQMHGIELGDTVRFNMQDYIGGMIQALEEGTGDEKQPQDLK